MSYFKKKCIRVLSVNYAIIDIWVYNVFSLWKLSYSFYLKLNVAKVRELDICSWAIYENFIGGGE